MLDVLSRIPKAVLIIAFFFFLCLINFGSNLHSEFMVDDFDLIKNQSLVKSPSLANFYEHFIPDYKIRDKIENSPPAAYYRPIAHILPSLQSLVFGQDPFGYHFTNAMLFALACLCFYVLLAELSGDQRLAFLAATLFCLHPINGFMVNYITASVYAVQLILLSLGVVFALWSLRKSRFLLMALVTFVFALLCHETSFMFPAYVFLVFWYRQRNIVAAFKSAFPFVMVAFVYFGMRLYFASLQRSLFAKAAFYDGLNAANYLATFLKLLVWYFYKFTTLQSPVIIWSTPLVKEGIGLWLVGGFTVTMLITWIVWKWKNSIKAVYACWFIFGLVPVTFGCLFLPKTGMMIEPHWLFFASFGLFALLATLLLQVTNKFVPYLRGLGFLAVCLLFLAFSWGNNTFWKDELTLTRHWVMESPTNKNAAFCYASALFKSGRLSEAKKWFLQALMNNTNDWQNYNNLAQISLRENDEAQALVYYTEALAVFPQSATVYNNLGTYYLGKSDFGKAEEFLRKAHELNPYQLEVLLNLGLAFEQQNRWVDVWENYLAAYGLRPKDERVLAVLIQTALNGHGHDEIITHTEEFLKEIRSEALLISLGAQLAMSGRNMLAEKYFLKALDLYPQKSAAYRDEGKVLANTGHFEQAEKMWEQGLQMNPQDQEIKDLLKELAVIRAAIKS